VALNARSIEWDLTSQDLAEIDAITGKPGAARAE